MGESGETGKACAESELVAQCPVGTNVLLEAQASSACSGSVDASTGVVDVNGSAVGQCQGSGSCQVYCQFQTPCPCGVARLGRDEVVCAECQAQSCGDGRCDGTERASCVGGSADCFACAEDCDGATCGDGDCTAAESPESCPQDCATTCVPNSVLCVGNNLRICTSDGSTFTESNCALGGLACVADQCVPANVCGNGLCEAAETPGSCAGDCAGACVPNAAVCQGESAFQCSASGDLGDRVDCAADSLICVGGGCVAANVCGNNRCEQGEDGRCGDCQARCGDGFCSAGLESAASCAQDCGSFCTPGAFRCEGDRLLRCNDDASEALVADCAATGGVCQSDYCAETNICGNGRCEGEEAAEGCADCQARCGDGVCENSESAQVCPQDCGTLCEPNARRCEGEVVVQCAPNGSTESRTSCATAGRICASWGECVDVGICSNSRCEFGESADNCPSDCEIVCGNGRCENGESVSCPSDCIVCGNGTCEANEPLACPQDCGVCAPNSRTCVGSILSVCAANGQSAREFDCAAAQQLCARGECVIAELCGNGACEVGEQGA